MCAKCTEKTCLDCRCLCHLVTTVQIDDYLKGDDPAYEPAPEESLSDDPALEGQL